MNAQPRTHEVLDDVTNLYRLGKYDFPVYEVNPKMYDAQHALPEDLAHATEAFGDWLVKLACKPEYLNPKDDVMYSHALTAHLDLRLGRTKTTRTHLRSFRRAYRVFEAEQQS